MTVTLEDTLKPWRDIIEDFPRTIAPYNTGWGGYIPPLYLDFIFAKHHPDWERRRQSYINDTIWGDLGQVFRGLFNAGTGVLRIVRGAIKLVPPIFLAWCIYKMVTGSEYIDHSKTDYKHDIYGGPSFWLAVEGELKGLGYDFVNGIGILLRGILQVVTTPLLIFRIPIRLAITFWEKEWRPKKRGCDFESVDEDRPLLQRKNDGSEEKKPDLKDVHTEATDVLPSQKEVEKEVPTQTNSELPPVVYPSPLPSPQAPRAPEQNLSPLMLYEVIPDESKPGLNVKVVVWSNISALGEDFLNGKEFILALSAIQKSFDPHIILLDSTIEFGKEVTQFFKKFENLGDKTLRHLKESLQGGISYSIFYHAFYDFRVFRKAEQGSFFLEGCDFYSDPSEDTPLAIRWISSVVSPNTEATRTRLLNMVYEQQPIFNYVSRVEEAKYQTGDHTIIIVPEGPLVPKDQSGLFYKSFKHPEKGVKRIEGKELLVDMTNGLVSEKQQQFNPNV